MECVCYHLLYKCPNSLRNKNMLHGTKHENIVTRIFIKPTGFPGHQNENDKLIDLVISGHKISFLRVKRHVVCCASANQPF